MPNVARFDTPAELRKHVAAVHIHADLGAVERKLINVLLLNAFDDLKTRDEFVIPVPVLCALIGWDESRNIPLLKDALKTLTTTAITFDLLYDPERPSDKRRSQWGVAALLSGANIVDGMCSYRYDRWLRTRLADPEIYAVIDIAAQGKFSGAYAHALYENCVRYRGAGSTGPIDVVLWRQLLGLGGDNAPKTYEGFKRFNDLVIKRAVREVNEVSNIVIEPEYIKEGRRVTAIRFSVTDKAQSQLAFGTDEEAIRQTATYTVLRAAGVGDKVIVGWISADPERAQDVARILEAKLQRGAAIQKPAAYASKIFTNGSDLQPPPSAASREPEADRRRSEKARREAIRAISPEQRRELLKEYVAEGGKAVSYNARTGKFGEVNEQMAFMQWLRTKVDVAPAQRS